MAQFIALFLALPWQYVGKKTMNESTSTELWDQMVYDFVHGGAAPTAHQEFFQPGVDRVALVCQALRIPGRNRMTALALLQKMTVDEQQRLFPELIQVARAAHGPVGAVREIIRSLPRKWVLAHIEPEVEAILANEAYDDYWMFLEFYQQLDASKALQLARRAAGHADPDIRELGLEWLADLPAPGDSGAA